MRQTSSMSSREAVNISPEFTIIKGMFKLVNNGVISVGSIFLFEIKLMEERLEREKAPVMRAQKRKEGMGSRIVWS